MKPLAITLGDPAGIGAEVVFRALGSMPAHPVRIFGSRALAEAALKRSPKAEFVDVGGEGPLQPGTVRADYGRIALDSVIAAVNAVRRGECSALVTAPVHKRAIALAGSPHPGHTELLAAEAGLLRYGHDYAMYFDSPRLRVALLSVHIPLSQVIENITAEKIAALARLVDREYPRLHGRRPRIAVAGVNPHAGEEGMFGDEETVIAQGVQLASETVTISGPHSPDTVFLRASQGHYDVVIAAYHDQGLIPVKTLAFDSSVNVTLGLPYLRCSVDHGTAFDIAGRGIADPGPMRYAIEWAWRHAEGFIR